MGRQDGNVSLVVAFTCVLMVMVVMFSTGIGSTAADATRMQAASDEAAVTAASGYLAALNDGTVLDALNWGVQALGNLGTTLTIVGEALIDAGVFTFGITAAIGAVFVAVGEVLSAISEAMAAVVTPLVEAAKPVLDVAKWVLAAANSTIIAGENGYFGFIAPNVLGSVTPATLSLADVSGVVQHSEAIVVDYPTDPYSTSWAAGSIKSALQLAALHHLWANSRATDATVTTTDGKKSTTVKKQARAQDTFHIFNDASNEPGCDPATWDPVGHDPFKTAVDDKGHVVPAPIPRDCTETGYLKQLTDRTYRDEIIKLQRLAAEINASDSSGNHNHWGGTQDDLDKANLYIDQAVLDLQSVMGEPAKCLGNSITAGSIFNTGLFGSGFKGLTIGCDSQLLPPPVQPPFGGPIPLAGLQTNGAFVASAFSTYDNHHGGTNCADPPITVAAGDRPPNPTRYYNDGAGSYERFMDCGHVSFPFGTTKLYAWWDSLQPAESPSTPQPPSDNGPAYDYRHTSAYRHSVGDAQGLANWAKGAQWPKGKSGVDTSQDNELIFVEFSRIDPTLQARLAANISGRDNGGYRYAIAGSHVQVVQSTAGDDVVNFGNLCGSIFNDDDPLTHSGDGILGLPSTAGGWCVWFADAVINIADVIGNIPDPFGSIVTDILGKPPDVHAWHVVLKSVPPIPYLCDASHMIRDAAAAGNDPGAFSGAVLSQVWGYLGTYFTGSGTSKAPETDCQAMRQPGAMAA